MRNRFNFDLLLVPISIMLLIGLNIYWLFQTYNENKKNLQATIDFKFEKTINALNDSVIRSQLQKSGIFDKLKKDRIVQQKPKIKEVKKQIHQPVISRIFFESKGAKMNDTIFTNHRRIKSDTSNNNVAIFISVNGKSDLDKLDSASKILISRAITSIGRNTDELSNLSIKIDTDSAYKSTKSIKLKPLVIDTAKANIKFVGFPSKDNKGKIEINLKKELLSLNEIDKQFGTALGEDKINIPFKSLIMDLKYKSLNDNKITAYQGTGIPDKTYSVVFDDYQGFLIKKMYSEILFSIFLIGITILAFALIYRNLQQQRRLTALKNDFISNVTHELKTPITTVGVAIEALSNFNVLQNRNQTKEYLDISKNELNRLGILVDKVLKMAIFEQKDLIYTFEENDLKQIIEKVLLTMKLQFEKYKAEVNFESVGDGFTLNCDAIHITNVIYNLLENALKYSPNPQISLNLEQINQNLIFRIKDNGIGIPKEYQTKVFEKFFRVPTGDVHDIKGYGLGLSYVKSVIDKHNGEIEINSEEGKGSEFKIILNRQ